MYKLEDLMKLKTLVTKELESDLRITKAIYNGIGGTDKDLYHRQDMITIMEVTTKLDKELDMEAMQEFISQDYSMKHIGEHYRLDGVTKSIGRSDYFDYGLLRVRWYVPITEITEQMIQTETKARLTKRLMPEGYDEYSFMLDCKLLEQFKAGTLTMEQVVEGSKGDCSI